MVFQALERSSRAEVGKPHVSENVLERAVQLDFNAKSDEI